MAERWMVFQLIHIIIRVLSQISITVNGKAVTVPENGKSATVSVDALIPEGEDTAVLKVDVETSEDANVYINSTGAASCSYTAFPEKGIVRIIVQEGEKEPYICYLKVTEKKEVPKLTDFTFGNLPYGTEFVFDAEAESQNVQYANSQSYFAITAEFDPAYTVTYSYEGTEGTLTSGTRQSIWTLPYGDTVLTVTVSDPEENTRIYTFHLNRPVSEDGTLYRLSVSYGNWPDTVYTDIYQLNADGEKTENTTIVDSHKAYTTEIAEDQMTFTISAKSEDECAQVRYSVDGGQSWKTSGYGLAAPADVVQA